MSAKHTPGPWTALRCQHGWHIGPQPDGVCSITDNSDGNNYKEHEANSRLIAAAPDLLAFAQWIVEPDTPIGSNAEFAMKARIKAAAAIAIAKETSDAT